MLYACNAVRPPVLALQARGRLRLFNLPSRSSPPPLVASRAAATPTRGATAPPPPPPRPPAKARPLGPPSPSSWPPAGGRPRPNAGPLLMSSAPQIGFAHRCFAAKGPRGCGSGQPSPFSTGASCVGGEAPLEASSGTPPLAPQFRATQVRSGAGCSSRAAGAMVPKILALLAIIVGSDGVHPALATPF